METICKSCGKEFRDPLGTEICIRCSMVDPFDEIVKLKSSIERMYAQINKLENKAAYTAGLLAGFDARIMRLEETKKNG